MATRLKAVLPLTLSIGLLAFLASEVALNFTFHWVTVQDGVFGKYGLPQNLHLVLPALFVAWGLYFMLGADRAALGKTMIAAATGTIGAGSRWSSARCSPSRRTSGASRSGSAITAAGLIVLSTAVEDDRFAPAPAFCCYAVRVLLVDRDRPRQLRPGRQGPHTAAAVTSAITDTPLAAGTGAFGGLLSMSWIAVALSVFVSLVCGALLGLAVRQARGGLRQAGRAIAPSRTSR